MRGLKLTREKEKYLMGDVRGKPGQGDFNYLLDRLGPVVERYPTWHPLVCRDTNTHNPYWYEDMSTPCIAGMDHSVYFRDGFITCPYPKDDAFRVVDVAMDMHHPLATLSAEIIDKLFYYEGTVSVIVECKWETPRNFDGTLGLDVVVPLILEEAIGGWRESCLDKNRCGELWSSMAPYFLGGNAPSSHFVGQKDARELRKIWEILNRTGMWGNINQRPLMRSYLGD
jgi:hypothetical protein